MLPFHYFSKLEIDAPSIRKQTLADFIDLDEANNGIVSAIVDFCYLVDTGNLDIAFKSLARIENDRVWKNLAKICIKKGRLDVALISLSHIGHAAAVAAVRKARYEDSVQLKAAVLAKYLGMQEEIEKLYMSAQRFDLLNTYYQELGQWDRALDIASRKDRINLRTTYVRFAEYLLEIDDRVGSAAALEKSSNSNIEIPLSFSANEVDLELFTCLNNEKNVKRWCAQFEESLGNFSSALKYYEEIEDILSIVRIHCFCGNLQSAEEICRSKSSKAAAYYLARHYEREEKISQSIEFYTAAQCFTQAIRLAKSFHLSNQLVNLALQGTPNLMLDVAIYFEASGQNLDKAITLLHRGGHLEKAVDLCFKSNQRLAETLGAENSPELLEKCASFFHEQGRFEQAILLLCNAKKFEEALDICLRRSIHITEAIAERFTFPDEASESAKILLNRLAELCLQQKSFYLACKKFSQARAYDSLSGFYESCCQVEIDEYQNYEKAMAALREAIKCLQKHKESDIAAHKKKSLQNRLEYMEHFINAKRVARSNPTEMLRTCEGLLEEPNIELAVRIGDIYALMIESHYASGDFQSAKDIVDLMIKKVPLANLDFYVDADIVRSLGYSHSLNTRESDGMDEQILYNDIA
ncbi:hypothetical protein HDU67_004120 [Dinochytrium kinnereticum]|nr:hypothetical protein HDU67_004120 [Dinochytrium kinnereticum]